MTFGVSSVHVGESARKSNMKWRLGLFGGWFLELIRAAVNIRASEGAIREDKGTPLLL